MLLRRKRSLLRRKKRVEVEGHTDLEDKFIVLWFISDLARARTQLVADTVYARDSQQSMARIFGEAAALGLSPDTVRDWPNLLADITAQEVRDAARLFLNLAHSVTGHLLEDGS